MSCCHVFLRSHRRRLSVCKEDFSLTLEMTIRESDVSQSFSLSPSHQSLSTRPFFQAIGAALSRIVIPSAAEGSFLHCGQYHIGTVRKRRLSATHILCLSVCKEDFSLALEMTIRESDVSSSPSLLVTSHTHTKRSCEEMNPHFSQPLFTLPSFGSGFSWRLRRLF